MTSVQSRQSSSLVTHSSGGTNLDNHLDDLQTGVRGHQNGLLNGFPVSSNITLPAGATGYRETTTTVTQERNGVPVTSRDYQIEYLNPANSVTVVSEQRSASPLPEYIRHADGQKQQQQQQQQSYQSAKYEYKYSESGTGKAPAGYSVSKTEVSNSSNTDRRNYNELDVLLHELNSAQRTPNPPRRSEHSSRSLERSPARGYPETSTPKRSGSSSREIHTYTERSYSPPGTPRAPQRNVQKEVHTIEARSHTSRRDTPTRSGEISSPTLRRRTPSPSGEFRPEHFSTYPYSPQQTRVYTSTSPPAQRRNIQETSKKEYTYSSHRSVNSSDDPNPYRSPSPVSFPQKRSPSPARRVVTRGDSFNKERTTTNYQIPNGHQLSDPTSPTVITYKYSSHSQQHSKYPGSHDQSYYGTPRPFPTPSPIPYAGEQNPPKKLDELMASFEESRRYDSRNEEYVTTRRETETTTKHNTDLQRSPSFERNLRPSSVKATQVYHQVTPQTPPTPVQEVIPAPTPTPQQLAAKNIAGPPVYYPPGVELFAKKEEAVMEQQSSQEKGKMKGKAKMKYKYEAGEKMNEKQSKRVVAAPVCLPLCCAMPCVIM